MPEALDALTDRLNNLRRGLIIGRPVVVVAPVLAGATTTVEELRGLGASGVLVVTFGDGTGPLPPVDVQVVRCTAGHDVHDVLGEIAAWTDLFTAPPPHVVAAIDQFDPDNNAIVEVRMPIAAGSSFAGRRTYGVRSAADQALEDKTRSLEMWRTAKVPHAPEEVVGCERTALRDSHTRLDVGAGTVWSADASHGLNGGGRLVYRVRTDADADVAFAALQPAAERVRVMPFLAGVPCSIHGLVTAHGVIVLRPVELVMLRQSGDPRFLQAGISSWWDPDDAIRDEMRAMARDVGEMLAREHDYRGAFGIDGIVTSDGFRPNELNPRFSGGLSNLAKGVTFPLAFLDKALRMREAVEFDVAGLERELLALVDERRFGSAYVPVDTVHSDAMTSTLVAGGPESLTPTEDASEATGTLEIGPASAGSLVRFTPLSLAPGDRLAPWAVAAYKLADRLWHTGIGALTAPDEAIHRQEPEPSNPASHRRP